MGIFVEKLTTDESICALKESVSIKDLLHLLLVDHGGENHHKSIE